MLVRLTKLIYIITSFLLISIKGSVSSSTDSSCLSIQSTAICSPWRTTVRIDKKILSKVYGIDQSNFTVKEWEKQILRATMFGNQSTTNSWVSKIQCPGYKGEAIQYLRSYICLTDLFVYSRKCNENLDDGSLPSLCKSTCKQYSLAVNKLLDDKSICSIDVEEVEDETIDKVRKVRKRLKKAFKTCANVGKQDFFDQDVEKCLAGVETDSVSCGKLIPY